MQRGASFDAARTDPFRCCRRPATPFANCCSERSSRLTRPSWCRSLPRFAGGIQVFEAYLAPVRGNDFSEEVIEGVGLVGPDRWVRSLTGSLKLLR